MLDRLKNIFQSNVALLLIDWISCISLFVLIKLFDLLVPPFKREFSLLDTTIQYTLTIKEMVPNWLLWVLGLVLPALIILLCYLVIKDIEKIHFALIGLLLSSGVAYFITHFLKNLIGRLRPDFIARCVPSPELIDGAKKSYQLFTSAICTQTDSKLLRGGMQSFPSGHTSTSFSGLGYLSYFLHHILKLSHRRAGLFQYYAVLIPLLIAIFVGVSRIRDYRHHWQDVLVGAIIGLLSAHFSYTQYFKKRAYTDNNGHLIRSSEDNALNNFNSSHHNHHLSNEFNQ